MMDIESKQMSENGGKVVFVAEVSNGMHSFRENLIKELEHFGCVIRQNADPDATGDYAELIEQCDVAIHILSDKDQIISTLGKGAEEFQINMSVQHFLSQKLISGTSENTFKIYAWHPKLSTESIYEEEKVPTHLKKIQQLDEVELIRTNFEEFKYYLLKKIESKEPGLSDEFYIKGSDNICIYFIYDHVDIQAAKPYIEYLNKRGFTVFTPEFDTDIMAVRQLHNSCLKKFDIAIIFAIDAGINWVNMKIMDILKSPGLGREKTILGKSVFLPETKQLMLQMKGRGFEYFQIDETFDKDTLEEFLGRIDF